MHNLKELRKNLDNLKKIYDCSADFDINDFNKKDTLNRDLINQKKNSSKKKSYQNQR